MQKSESYSSVPEWFTTQVSRLFLLYPGRTQQPGTTAAWWTYLGDLQRDKLQVAFDRAPRTSPVYVPSAQVVREIAMSLPATQSKLELRPVAELEEMCTLGGDNPFRALADKWANERVGEGPGAAGVSKQRLELLSRMLAEAMIGHVC